MRAQTGDFGQTLPLDSSTFVWKVNIVEPESALPWIGLLLLLAGHRFQFFCIHFYRGSQIDEFEGHDESETGVLPHQDALYPPHRAAFDAYFLADNKVVVGLYSLQAEVRAKKVDLRV